MSDVNQPPVHPQQAQSHGNIGEKIIATINQIGVLQKDETNKFANFDYVPIDAYYRIVARAAADHGIALVIKEIDCVPVYEDGKAKAILFKYQCSILHEDGGVAYDVDRCTIYHPIQGAQTTMSARSYAEKCFMRSIFKVETGEQDADSTNPADLSLGQPRIPDIPGRVPGPPMSQPMAPPPQNYPQVPQQPPAPPSNISPPPVAEPPPPPSPPPASEAKTDADFTPIVSEYVSDGGDTYPVFKRRDQIEATGHQLPEAMDMAAKAFTTFLPSMHNAEMVKEFWNRNQITLNLMKNNFPDLYEQVVSSFRGRNQELS